MDIDKLDALSDFMRAHSVSVSELKELADYANFYKGIPLLEKGQELSFELRYADGEITNKFIPMRRIKGVHFNGMDIGLEEPSVPLPYLAALQYCRQMGKRMMTAKQAQELFSEKEKVNTVLEQICAEPIKGHLYWVDDKASKPYLAKVIDLHTGQIKEVKRSNSFRVRPIWLF